MDANQTWGDEAIAAMRTSARDPWWIEEPTSPDDVLGHARIRREIAPDPGTATGEHVQNRVIFKQLFQADAIDAAQIDACRIPGVNEVVADQLLAAKFGIPGVSACGRVGLCELHPASRRISTTSGSAARSRTGSSEWVDHLHEHFREPAVRARRTGMSPRPLRVQHGDAARVARRVRISRRAGLGRRRTHSRPQCAGEPSPKQIEAGARTSRDRFGFSWPWRRSINTGTAGPRRPTWRSSLTRPKTSSPPDGDEPRRPRVRGGLTVLRP